MADDRVDLVCRAYEHLNDGDFEAALALIHPDVEWHTYIVPRPGGGLYHGHVGVRALWADAREIFGEFKNIAEEVIEVGDHVVSHVTVEGVGVRSGVAVQARIAHVFTFRDGKVATIHSFSDRDEAMRVAQGG